VDGGVGGIKPPKGMLKGTGLEKKLKRKEVQGRMLIKEGEHV
jgi:hypothetical protein